MYDKLPYKRDSDLCNGQAISMHSKYMIKYYRCKDIYTLNISPEGENTITYNLAMKEPENSKSKTNNEEKTSTESIYPHSHNNEFEFEIGDFKFKNNILTNVDNIVNSYK